MSNFRPTRVDRFPPIVKNLIIINVLVFVAQLIFDKEYALTLRLALWPVETPLFEPYQVFTHMFTHSPSFIFHIIMNMLILYSFGRILENIWGPKRFLFFYLACGIGAAATHLAMQYFMGDAAPAVGASGAIMGVFVAFAYLFPNTELMIIPIPIPIKAKWLVLAYIAFDLFGGFGGVGTGIAHFAHLGGALTGFIIVMIWNKTNRKTLY